MRARAAHLRAGALLLSFALGCSSCEEQPVEETDAPETPTEEAAADPGGARVGTVTGRVVLAEGFALPHYERSDLQGQNATAPWPAHCTPPGEDDLYPLKLGEDRGLQGMLVAATAENAQGFTEALGEWEPQRHVVTITDCRLEPRLVSATRGDVVVVRNETNHAFLPRLGPSSFMQGALQGEEIEFNLERGGVLALDCSFGSPCGRADVVTLYRPVHTITGEDGAFTMPNVPGGIPVMIRAWHPIYGNVDVSVETQVSVGGSETVTLTLTPPTTAAPTESPEPTPAPDADEATPTID